MQGGSKSNKYVKKTKINVVHLTTSYDLSFSVIMCLHPLCLQTCKITIPSAVHIFCALKYGKYLLSILPLFMCILILLVIAFINACLVEYSESPSFHSLLHQEEI